MNVTFKCRLRLQQKFNSSSSSFLNNVHHFRYVHHSRKLLLPNEPRAHNQHSFHLNKNVNLMHVNRLYFDVTKRFYSSNIDDNDNSNKPSPSSSETVTIETKSTDKKEKKKKNDDDKIDRRAYPIAFSSLLMGIGIGVILPVMPQFANEIGINTMQYGLVISVMGITRLIMNIPAGLITDKFGRKIPLVGGPFISSLGTLVIAFANSMNELVFSRVITGAGGSLQMAGAQAYLSDISTIRNRARTMAPLVAAFSAGAVVGPAIGGFLCDYYQSVRIPFIFVACAIGAVALNNMIMLPETLKLKNREDEDSKPTLKTTIINMKNEWKLLLKDVSHISCIGVHTAFWFTQAGATFTLMPLFATNELGCSATQIGGIFAMMSIINVIGSQPFAWIADKYGRKKVMVPSIFIISCCVPLIAYCTSINDLYRLMFIYSIGSTMLGTSPTAYIADIHKSDKRSQALAMLRSGGDTGLMIGSGLLGYLTHITHSFTVSMTTASILLFLSGTNFAMRAKETAGHLHHKIEKKQ